MEAQDVILQNKGMYQDSSISKSSNEFAFENYGIRITGELDNTLLSVTNEKGPIRTHNIEGTYLGKAVLGKYLIVFTTGTEYDYIYRIIPGEECEVLYMGHLNFDTEHPIETLPWYESDDIQKVYWVDGKNYTRFINIVGKIKPDNDYQFDFSTRINSLPKVDIEKSYEDTGLFSQGTIQYFITYYNKYGAETPIVWQSALHYISYSDRGAKADEVVSCGFRFEIKDIDYNYDYIRIYSAQRSSNDGPISARLVADLKLPTKEEVDNFEEEITKVYDDGSTKTYKSRIFKIRFTDLGTQGEAIDPTMLYYIGGQSFKASTLTQKDGVLFVGDINIEETSIENKLKKFFKDKIEKLLKYKETTPDPITKEKIKITNDTIRECPFIRFSTKRIEAPKIEGFYSHKQQIGHSQYNVATFKRGEIYRFAIQFMTKVGEWTSPIWIGDKKCDIAPTRGYYQKSYLVANAVFNWPSELSDLVEEKYIAYRLLMAETSPSTRNTIAQGVVNPTLFNYYERYYNQPSNIASWNFRPRNSKINSRHMEGIGGQCSSHAELQGLRKSVLPLIDIKERDLETFSYYNLILGIDAGTEMVYKLIVYNLPETKEDIEKVVKGEKSLPAYNGNINDAVEIAKYKASGCYKVISSGRVDRPTWNKVINTVYNNIRTDCEKANASKGGTALISGAPITADQMPSKKEIKAALNQEYKLAIAAIVLESLVVIAAIVASVFTFGAAAPASALGATTACTAIASALGTIGTLTVGSLCVATSVLGATAIATSSIDQKKASKIEKQLAKKGWYRLGRKKDVEGSNGIGKLFKKIDGFNRFQGTNNGSFWETGGRLTFKSAEESIVDSKKEQYFVDNSVITFNSPDLEDNQDIINNNQSLGFRVVGVIPINSVYSDYLLETETPGFNPLSDVIKSDKSFSRPLQSFDTEGLLSGFLYQDSDYKNPITDGKLYKQQSVTGYKVFLWNRETSLSVGGNHENILVDSDGNRLDINPAKLKHKIFANLRYSSDSEYFNLSNLWEPRYGIRPIKIFNSEELTALDIHSDEYDFDYYYGNYDNVVTFNNKYEILTIDNYTETNKNSDGIDVMPPFGLGTPTYQDGKYIYKDEKGNDKFMVTDPVRIKFKSTPHAVVSFVNEDLFQPILPKLIIEPMTSYKNFYGRDYSDTGFYNDLDNKVGTQSSVFADYLKGMKHNNTIMTIDISSTNTTSNLEYDEKGKLKKIKFNPTSNKSCYDSFVKQLVDCVYLKYSSKVYYKEFKENNILNTTILQVYNKYLVEDYFVNGKLVKIIFRIKVNEGTRTINTEEGPKVTKVYNYYYVKANKLYFDENNNPNWEVELSTIPINKGMIIGSTSKPTVTLISGTEYSYKMDDSKSKFIINENDSYLYNGHSVFVEDSIKETKPVYPYLYIGELYKKSYNYHKMFGGYDDNALERLKWKICSTNTKVKDNILITWGDTYYQRYDCLKSYPFTEEDTNSIVDILSFMVESYTNLDGRCDINRGIVNIINARPTNFNLINKAYSQCDNILRYNILDEKFDLSRFKNQVVWSLPKLNTADVDTWTNITLNNILSLDGSYDDITKLENYNDTILAFQKKAISTIDFNNKTPISTENGVPLEIANSGKVNGYTLLTTNSGCVNKWSIINAGSGIFFMDDLNKSLMRFNKEGMENIGIKYGMSKFFRDNTYGESWKPGCKALRLSYDGLTQDIYINSNEYSLLFNEKLGAFTSFMPYEGFADMLTINGESYAIKSEDTTNLFKMFAGDYNKNYKNEYYNYVIKYKVNNEPYVDKTFTNIEYVADTFIPSKSVDSEYVLDRTNPFNKLEVWNEYQYGSCVLSEKVMPSDLRQKFRIWRANIPRDKNSKYGLDRIRNPWCYLSLTGTPNNNNKMVFHQATVKYFK